jgi:hypothetical protein
MSDKYAELRKVPFEDWSTWDLAGLLADRDALHKELREICVGKSGCIACRTQWLVGESERHTEYCLARPVAPPTDAPPTERA